MKALTVTLATVLTCIWVAESKAATKVVSKAATKVVSKAATKVVPKAATNVVSKAATKVVPKAAKAEVAEPEVATQPPTESVNPLRQKKEELLRLGIDSLDNYEQYFDMFIRLFMHYRPGFMEAPIKRFWEYNQHLLEATIFTDSIDAFIDAGRVDKYVDDGKVWATLKHILKITNTMKEEIEPTYRERYDLIGIKNVFAFTKNGDEQKVNYPQEEIDKFHEYVSLFKKIIGRYIVVLKYLKSFLSHHTDIITIFDRFVKKYEQLTTNDWRKLNNSLHKMDDGMSYSRQERYVPAMKRMYVLSKELEPDLAKLEGLLS